MNILILSWRSLKHPNSGGAEQVTYEHAKAWVRAGHDVTWFSSSFKNAKEQEVMGGVEIIRKGNSIMGVHVKSLFWYLFKKPKKFDLVVDEIHGIPFFTPLYVKVTKLAFIHEVAKEVWRYNPWPRPINIIPAVFGRLFEPLIIRFIYRKVPFMTVSESTKKDLISWGIPNTSITVIHNGVTLDLPSTLPKKETIFTAMYLGAVSRDKGTFDVIKIFAEIAGRDEDWQFWVVGKGTPEYLKKLRDMARNYHVEKKVKFWGFVSNRKKFELLARAHVLINPSVREGWGLVNIEANYVGTPVVGYNVAGTKDSIKDGKTGILVKVGDYRSLGENALKLVRDRQKYNIFREKAEKWSRNFTWQKATNESRQLIESL
jgi:glycosyltransferase involved in cell wall biosynthesis